MSSATAERTENPAVVRPELDLADLARMGAGRILAEIARNCVAVRVSCHGIGHERKLAGAVVTVDNQQVADEFSSGARARLIPITIQKKLDQVVRKARDLPKSYGTPFVGGAYLVPTAVAAGRSRPAAEAMFEQLAAIRVEYRETAAGLRPEWEAHMLRLEREQPALYEIMTKKRWLVDGPTFVSRHTIDSVLFPLGGGLPADFTRTVSDKLAVLAADSALSTSEVEALGRLAPRIAGIVVEAAQQAGRRLGEAETATWAREARQETSRMIAETVANMVQEPLVEFAEALASVEGIIEREGSLRDASLANVRTAYEKLKGFSFLADSDLIRRLDGVDARIRNLTPAHLNGASNRGTAEGLAQVFREVRAEVTAEDTHRRAFGQFARRIVL